MNKTYVEIFQNSGGRTGHKFKDFVTGIILYFLFDFKLIRNKTWKFPDKTCQNHLHMFNIDDPDLFVKCPPDDAKIVVRKLHNWGGLGHYNNLKHKILEEYDNPNQSIILQLQRATRIGLHDVYNWQMQGHIPPDSYSKITDYLRNRYFKRNPLKKTNNHNNVLKIAIHIRKGDVFDKREHKSVSYYSRIIKQLRDSKLNAECTIYSETWKGYEGKDLFQLVDLENSHFKIKIVFELCLYHFFGEIISSNIFIATVGQGSLSDMALHYKMPNCICINNTKRQTKLCDDMGGRIINADLQKGIDINQLYKVIDLRKFISLH